MLSLDLGWWTAPGEECVEWEVLGSSQCVFQLLVPKISGTFLSCCDLKC